MSHHRDLNIVFGENLNCDAQNIIRTNLESYRNCGIHQISHILIFLLEVSGNLNYTGLVQDTSVHTFHGRHFYFSK